MASGCGAIIVTGGSRGIGAAISKRLAADGYAILVNYARDETAARAVVRAIEAAGGRALAHQADVACERAIAGMFEASDRGLGPLAGLVNNAGIIGVADRRFAQQERATLLPLLETNVLAPMLCSAQAIRRLSTREGGPGGSIVSLSSVAARTGASRAPLPTRLRKAPSRASRAGWPARWRVRVSASTRSRRA